MAQVPSKGEGPVCAERPSSACRPHCQPQPCLLSFFAFVFVVLEIDSKAAYVQSKGSSHCVFDVCDAASQSHMHAFSFHLSGVGHAPLILCLKT